MYKLNGFQMNAVEGCIYLAYVFKISNLILLTVLSTVNTLKMSSNHTSSRFYGSVVCIPPIDESLFTYIPRLIKTVSHLFFHFKNDFIFQL